MLKMMGIAIWRQSVENTVNSVLCIAHICIKPEDPAACCKSRETGVPDKGDEKIRGYKGEDILTF